MNHPNGETSKTVYLEERSLPPSKVCFGKKKERRERGLRAVK